VTRDVDNVCGYIDLAVPVTVKAVADGSHIRRNDGIRSERQGHAPCY
jgi:hypothetical protein